MSLPTGILQPTTRPDRAAGPGAEPPADDGPELTTGAKTPKAKKRKAAAAGSDKVEDVKLYLSEDVRFRLRMLAFKRGAKLSTVANEVLDKALPRWTLERTE